MNATRRAAACAVAMAAVVVGCGSGSIHGRSAAESSGVVALSSPASAASAPAPASAVPPSASASIVDPAAGTAAALAKDHWSALPPAPITARYEPASAWTGRQLLIWGGDERGDQLAHDGASYDPTTKAWTKLPAAPISARAQMASVWTGSELFAWGGDTADGTSKNGAIYNPATMTWQKLPSSPLSPRAGAQAIWVDNEVIVIGGYPPDSSTSHQVHTELAAFNPATNHWTALAPMPVTSGHVVIAAVAAATNDRVYVWEEWQHVTSSSDEESIDSGIDLYVFDPVHNRWTPDTAASRPNDGQGKGNAPAGISSALWTGTSIVVPWAERWCGLGMCPASLPAQDQWLNPATNAWTTIASGPIDNLGPQEFVWTGNALIAFDTGGTVHGSGVNIVQGQAAVWDPHTDVWTRLPAAPLFNASVAVWDGDELLVWGMLNAPADTGSVPSDTTGLQFGP